MRSGEELHLLCSKWPAAGWLRGKNLACFRPGGNMSKESAKLSTAKLGRSLWSWREAVFGRCKCRTSSCRPAAWWKMDQAQACLHFCLALALLFFFLGGLVQPRLSLSQIPVPPPLLCFTLPATGKGQRKSCLKPL